MFCPLPRGNLLARLSALSLHLIPVGLRTKIKVIKCSFDLRSSPTTVYAHSQWEGSWACSLNHRESRHAWQLSLQRFYRLRQCHGLHAIGPFHVLVGTLLANIVLYANTTDLLPAKYRFIRRFSNYRYCCIRRYSNCKYHFIRDKVPINFVLYLCTVPAIHRFIHSTVPANIVLYLDTVPVNT